MYAPVLRYAYYGHPYLRGALPKLEVLDLQENGKITDAQALVSALAGGALPSLAVLRFVGTAHLKVTLARTPTPTLDRHLEEADHAVELALRRVEDVSEDEDRLRPSGRGGG